MVECKIRGEGFISGIELMYYLFIILVFFICHFIYQTYNMFVGKFAGDLTLFGISFKSHWSFALIAVLSAAPILTVANYGFGMGFYFGKQYLTKIWLVLILFLMCQLAAMIIGAYVFFKEWPSQGTLIGMLLTVTGFLVAIVWK